MKRQIARNWTYGILYLIKTIDADDIDDDLSISLFKRVQKIVIHLGNVERSKN